MVHATTARLFAFVMATAMLLANFPLAMNGLVAASPVGSNAGTPFDAAVQARNFGKDDHHVKHPQWPVVPKTVGPKQVSCYQPPSFSKLISFYAYEAKISTITVSFYSETSETVDASALYSTSFDALWSHYDYLQGCSYMATTGVLFVNVDVLAKVGGYESFKQTCQPKSK